MEQSRLIELLELHIAGQLPDSQWQELLRTARGPQGELTVRQALEAILNKTSAGQSYDAARFDPILRQVLDSDIYKVPVPVIRRIPILRRIAAAAAILILLGAGGYFLIHSRSTSDISATQIQHERFKNDASPGKNGAVLTLSGGQKIVLDSVGNGTVAVQGNVNLVKTADGQITYRQSAAGNQELIYNTLVVPRGSKVVTLTLADGSKVWLNSESSLKYPVVFLGTERRVEITGEAYFEVAHDSGKTFYVAAGGVTTEVLGTHFNVNAYKDENEIKITLLEGLIKVTSPNPSNGGLKENVVIKPGQQAQAGASIKVNSDVDMEAVMAWKNGLFHFNNSSLQDVMRQIARWYDVEIEYKGAIPTRQFGGEISRNSNASEVLKILELSKVHFQIDGRKIVVMP